VGVEPELARLLVAQGEEQVLDFDARAVRREDDAALDHVLQLADVARPG
jgi:hypothetical protein